MRMFNQPRSIPQFQPYQPYSNQSSYSQTYKNNLSMGFNMRKSGIQNSPGAMNAVSMYKPPTIQKHVNSMPITSKSVASPHENLSKPKMLWGRHTWFLFHTIAEKIKDERFDQLRNEIIHLIYTICMNLPCPLCTEHAKEYLANSDLLKIQTKEQLKYELFKFHNTVNRRKDYPEFTVEQLNTMYKTAVPRVIIQNFLIHFNSKSKSVRLIADELYRQKVTQNLKGWFDIHLSDFEDGFL